MKHRLKAEIRVTKETVCTIELLHIDMIFKKIDKNEYGQTVFT